MRLIFKAQNQFQPKKPNTYVVMLPNYFDVDHVEELLEEVSTNCLNGAEVYDHYLMGDDTLTNDERKQIDIYGKVVDAPTVLSCPELLKR